LRAGKANAIIGSKFRVNRSMDDFWNDVESVWSGRDSTSVSLLYF